MKNVQNRQVYCLPGKGGAYGSGHYRRMSVLTRLLQSQGISARLTLDESEIQGAENSVLVFDKRDDELSPQIRDFQLNGLVCIALDNRGRGRRQANWAIDTLPHPDMNDSELGLSLEHVLLDPDFTGLYADAPQKSLSKNAEIFRIENSEIERFKEDKRALIYSPGLEIPGFHEKLKSSQSIVTYFGQTLFEALYCGKTVYLYEISPYHKILADWFSDAWKNTVDLAKRIDGFGYARLIQKIKEIV